MSSLTTMVALSSESVGSVNEEAAEHTLKKRPPTILNRDDAGDAGASNRRMCTRLVSTKARVDDESSRPRMSTILVLGIGPHWCWCCCLQMQKKAGEGEVACKSAW